MTLWVLQMHWWLTVAHPLLDRGTRCYDAWRLKDYLQVIQESATCRR